MTFQTSFPMIHVEFPASLKKLRGCLARSSRGIAKVVLASATRPRSLKPPIVIESKAKVRLAFNSK